MIHNCYRLVHYCHGTYGSMQLGSVVRMTVREEAVIKRLG